MYHLISKHSGDNQKIPDISPQFLTDTFIRKQETEWMGISHQDTDDYRHTNQIPDSDAINALVESQKRMREWSGTESTTGSDSHKLKQTKI
jgi:hypothetical protein